MRIPCNRSYDDCSAYKAASSTHCRRSNNALCNSFIRSSWISEWGAKAAVIRRYGTALNARTVLSYHSSCLSKARCALNCLMACSTAKYPPTTLTAPVITPVTTAVSTVSAFISCLQMRDQYSNSDSSPDSPPNATKKQSPITLTLKQTRYFKPAMRKSFLSSVRELSVSAKESRTLQELSAGGVPGSKASGT